MLYFPINIPGIVLLVVVLTVLHSGWNATSWPRDVASGFKQVVIATNFSLGPGILIRRYAFSIGDVQDRCGFRP